MKLLLATMLCAAFVLNGAQDTTTDTVYRLEVAIHEVENDKRVDTRNYTLLVRNGTRATSRTGTRVPISVGGEDAKSIQYVDVGANLDFKLDEVGGEVKLSANLELSDAGNAADGVSAPAIRQVRYRVETLIPAGQKTVIGRLDEPEGKTRYEVEVNPVKVER